MRALPEAIPLVRARPRQALPWRRIELSEYLVVGGLGRVAGVARRRTRNHRCRGGAVPEPEEAPPALIDAPLLQVHLDPRHPVAYIESCTRRRGLARRLVEREHEPH